MIGADLDALVNCDVIHNVSPPPNKEIFPDGPNTAWLKPGGPFGSISMAASRRSKA